MDGGNADNAGAVFGAPSKSVFKALLFAGKYRAFYFSRPNRFADVQ